MSLTKMHPSNWTERKQIMYCAWLQVWRGIIEIGSFTSYTSNVVLRYLKLED